MYINQLFDRNLCDLDVITVRNEDAAPPLLGIGSIQHLLGQHKLDATAMGSQVILGELAALRVVAEAAHTQVGGSPVAFYDLHLPVVGQGCGIEADGLPCLSLSSRQLGTGIAQQIGLVCPVVCNSLAFPKGTMTLSPFRTKTPPHHCWV